MSSTESLIAEIEAEYNKIVELTGSIKRKARQETLPVGDVVNYYEQIVRFRTFLESKGAQTKMFSGAQYYERASAKVEQILTLFNSQEIIKDISSGSVYRDDRFQSVGKGDSQYHDQPYV